MRKLITYPEKTTFAVLGFIEVTVAAAPGTGGDNIFSYLFESMHCLSQWILQTLDHHVCIRVAVRPLTRAVTEIVSLTPDAPGGIENAILPAASVWRVPLA